MSPFALVAKKLIKTVRILKNKGKDYKSWQDVIAEIRTEAKKLKKKEKAKRLLKERLDLFKNILRDEGAGRIVKKLDVFGLEDVGDMDTVMMRAKEQEKKLTNEEKMAQAPVKLIRQGLKLAMMLSGQNVSDFNKKNVKMISPRLLSLVPDEADEKTINLLSPSLFALHDQGRGIEDQLSLARAMKYFDEQGHQEWLNLVIEASGVSDAVKRIREVNTAEESRRMDEQFRGDNGQPLYFTKENVTEMFGQTERRKMRFSNNYKNL
ncbi:hypothetical protein KIN20_033617 [Parelaphostrongylus tenuis]|uniref:Uncharacterized protein n=1 Tax=Parelaphostrongylus tenuis TaxID=148309 RepID=A0AAD5WIK6_PARTN|nr:hypothetical protein KIN20_033617 [Parelaphostrongylus tenuis]